MVLRLSKPLSIIALLLVCFFADAQVQLEGEVSHNGDNQDNVTIQVFENGKLNKTIAANKRGKYHIDFPFNHKYLLVFRCPYMIPVSIEMDTELPHESSEKLLVEVPVNMELFKRFEQLDTRAYQKPIGIIQKTGNPDIPCAFYPNQKNIEAVKLVNSESKRLESIGAKAILTSDNEIESLVEVESSIDKKSNRIPETIDQNLRTSELSPTEISTDDPAKEIIEAADTRYKQQEAGEIEEKELLRNQLIKKQYSNIEASGNKQEFIYIDKEARRDKYELEMSRSQDLIDSKVQKQQQIDEDLLAQSKEVSANTVSSSKKAQEIIMDQGFIISEEVLKVREGSKMGTYKHVNYDWLLFQVDYYYREESEITKGEYEEARKLFD
jgi:hypothetical protein